MFDHVDVSDQVESLLRFGRIGKRIEDACGSHCVGVTTSILSSRRAPMTATRHSRFH